MKVKNISGQVLRVGRFVVKPGNYFPNVPFTEKEIKGIERFKSLKFVDIEEQQPVSVKVPTPMVPKAEDMVAPRIVAEPEPVAVLVEAPMEEPVEVQAEELVEQPSEEIEEPEAAQEEAPVSKPKRRRSRG